MRVDQAQVERRVRKHSVCQCNKHCSVNGWISLEGGDIGLNRLSIVHSIGDGDVGDVGISDIKLRDPNNIFGTASAG